MQEEGEDQRLAIADMKLDFGRLYWLQGMKYEQGGRLRQDAALLEKALEKYKEANSVSEKARQEFEQMSLPEEVVKARVSKAWGNLGNAAKEIASYMASSGEWDRVQAYGKTAEQHYGKNLSLGEEILKKDEISHALAGLAEVHCLMSSRTDPPMETSEKRLLLEKAEKEAQRAHRLYEELAGPRGQMVEGMSVSGNKTRDEIRTEQLINDIRRPLAPLRG